MSHGIIRHKVKCLEGLGMKKYFRITLDDYVFVGFGNYMLGITKKRMQARLCLGKRIYNFGKW